MAQAQRRPSKREKYLYTIKTKQRRQTKQKGAPNSEAVGSPLLALAAATNGRRRARLEEGTGGGSLRTSRVLLLIDRLLLFLHAHG